MRRLLPCLLLLVTAAWPSSALALEREVLATPPDPSGLMVTTPSRVEQDVEPGVRTTLEIEVYNDDSVPIDVSLIPYDIGPTDVGEGFATRVDTYEFSATKWIQFEEPNLRLKPFERVKFKVYLDPPLTAPVGTNLAGIAVRGGPASGEIGTHDDTGLLQIDALVQLMLTIPGELRHDLSVERVEVKDTLVLGRTRLSVVEVTFRNDGNVTERVTGALAMKSLFGTTAASLDIGNLAVARGSTRTKRFVWRDMPWVGAFTPTVTAKGNEGEQVTASGGRIVVVPWWLPVAIGLSVLLPIVWIWWRRRQDWMQYLDDEDLDEWSDSGHVPG